MNVVRGWPNQNWGPPLQSTDAIDMGSRWPQTIMPPRIEGWSRGVVASNEAEELMESAVAWWDSSRYRAGDRFWRNQGTAGELLDFRLGSSSVAANSNDPTWLNPDSLGYVWLPGLANNVLTVPDAADLDITGDIDIRFCGQPDFWISSADQTFVSKWQTAGQRSWRFYASSTNLCFDWSVNGTDSAGVTSTIATPPFDVNTFGWVRVTLDVDNGADGSDVKFYTSEDGVSWTQYGDTVTTAGPLTLFSGTSRIEIGGHSGGASALLNGRVYCVQVLNGIEGSTVLNADCDAINSSSNSFFVATTGQTVSIGRPSTPNRSKTCAAMPSRGKGGRALFALGNDDFFEIPRDLVWQHQLCNFNSIDSFTVFFVYAIWANQDNYNPWINKNQLDITTSTASRKRWQLCGGGTNTRGKFIIDDALNVQERTNANIVSAYLRVAFGVVNSQKGYMEINGSGFTSGVSVKTTKSLVNNETVKICQTVNGTFNRMELYGAGIFRRALTTREMTVIRRYYGAQ